MEKPETYYREVNSSVSDEVLAISVIEFRVVRRTARGCWITPHWNPDDNLFLKFILDGEGRRYAYPTRELARQSYIIRKKREIMHCRIQHDRAVRYLALAETGKFGNRSECVTEIQTFDLLLPET